MTTFYLHKDDWGMINLLSAENAVWVEEISQEAQEAQEAQQASRENFAGFAQFDNAQLPTYHNIYVIPEEKYPISERNIHLDDLRSLLPATWPEVHKVESGYSSHAEELDGTFAFGAAHGGGGAFYGSHKDGKVTSIHIIRPSCDDPHALQPFVSNFALPPGTSMEAATRRTDRVRQHPAGGKRCHGREC